MVITLCGSARFRELFNAWERALKLSGCAVFGITQFLPVTDEEKKLLDEVHLKMIERSDAIVVINHFAYIGESTLKEIEFAKEKSKRLYAIESWGEGCGIGSNHLQLIQSRAKRGGVYGKYSPINTTYPYFKYAYDLLPEAGELRNRLVKELRNAGWWADECVRTDLGDTK